MAELILHLTLYCVVSSTAVNHIYHMLLASLSCSTYNGGSCSRMHQQEALTAEATDQ